MKRRTASPRSRQVSRQGPAGPALLRLSLRLFVFFFIFVIEVRVKAAESVRLPLIVAKDLVQQPSECLKNSSESCAVATIDRQKFQLDLGGAKVWLDQNTSIIRVSLQESSVSGELEIRLLKGMIWVQTTKPIRVTSEYGAFASSEANAEFWVRREMGRVVGSSVHQALELRSRGAKETLSIPEGLENWMGRVGDAGEGTTGVPLPIVFSDHVQRWARLFPGKKKDFEAEVEKFHAEWVEAAQLSADIHQSQYERKVASIPDPALQSREPPKKIAVDPRKRFNDMINSIFRKKFFSGE